MVQTARLSRGADEVAISLMTLEMFEHLDALEVRIMQCGLPAKNCGGVLSNQDDRVHETARSSSIIWGCSFFLLLLNVQFQI